MQPGKRKKKKVFTLPGVNLGEIRKAIWLQNKHGICTIESHVGKATLRSSQCSGNLSNENNYVKVPQVSTFFLGNVAGT